jgi:16S rRNA (guanine527-N7)-methyltransferase
VLHSLAIAAIFDFTAGIEVADIGTGGGFPGIPLAIFFPEVKFHLVDSIAKKLKVVNAVAEGAAIKNVTTQHIRAEDIKNKKFDFVVSRAVAPLKELWKWSKPLLRSRNPDADNYRKEGQTSDFRPQTSDLRSQTSDRTQTPGLICLKGGDLTLEIQDSGTRPRIMEISEIFREEYFKMKYLLYVPR